MKSKSTLKISKSPYGAVFHIVLEGVAEEIEMFFNKLFNYKFIDAKSKLKWISSNKGCFNITRVNYKKAKIKAEDIPFVAQKEYNPDELSIGRRDIKENLEWSAHRGFENNFPLDLIVKRFHRK